MGQNLKELFTGLSQLDDDAIRAVHPHHDRASIQSALQRFHYFEQGTCIVHHMFGADVVRIVEDQYADVFVTAHLEVPGEMFQLALAAQQKGRGVVGSTSNILGFIAAKVEQAANQEGEALSGPRRLRFILGTEAGMITAIVRKVQRILDESGAPIEVEIIFPVASEAVAQTDDPELGVVPGVAGGEGCSTAGGCATCPYMKMNSLDAMFDVLERTVTEPRDNLLPFFPRKYTMQIEGRTAAELGGEPILHMRHFQREGQLPDALVGDILGRQTKTG